MWPNKRARQDSNVAVEDELDFEEVVSTGTANRNVPHHACVLDGSADAKVVTFYDEKKS
jgi:hypothetical protein